MGETTARRKVKSLGWDKESLIGQEREIIMMMMMMIMIIMNDDDKIIRLYKTRDAEFSCSSPTDWCLAKSWAAAPGSLPQPYMLSMLLWDLEHPLDPLRSAVSAVSPPTFPTHPSSLPAGMGWGAAKVSTLCRHCCAITKTSLSYQHYSHLKSSTRKKINFIPAETGTLLLSRWQTHPLCHILATLHKIWAWMVKWEMA